MIKQNQEIKDQATLQDILSLSTICRIAMLDQGEPYLLPFNFGYRDNCIYVHSAQKGKKIAALSTNPRVCFEVVQQADLVKGSLACDWSTLYRSPARNCRVLSTVDVERLASAVSPPSPVTTTSM